MPWWFYAAAVFWSIVPAVIMVGVPWAFIAEWRHERWRARMEADAERRLSDRYMADRVAEWTEPPDPRDRDQVAELQRLGASARLWPILESEGTAVIEHVASREHGPTVLTCAEARGYVKRADAEALAHAVSASLTHGEQSPLADALKAYLAIYPWTDL